MYIDPGLGSILIQVLVASLAAAAAVFGIFRTKIMAFFKKGRNGEKPSDGENTNG